MFKIVWDEFPYSRRQFGLWRACFGLYLLLFHLWLLPYAPEMFSREGPFADASIASPDLFPSHLIPNWLLGFDSVLEVRLLIVAGALMSTLLMIGYHRRAAAFVLWLFAVWRAAKTPLAISTELPFVNWLIFACAFIPEGEGFGLGPVRQDWKMPRMFYWGAWIVLSAAYFFAGSFKFKFGDPSWINGSAIYHALVTGDGRRTWYGSLFSGASMIFFAPFTYGALALETLAPLFVFFRRTRPWWWLISTTTHLLALVFLNLDELTLGMLFFHFFVFDSRWLNVRIKLEQTAT